MPRDLPPAASLSLPTRSPLTQALRAHAARIWAAWRSVTPRELGWTALFGVLDLAVDFSLLPAVPVEIITASAVARHIAVALVAALALLLAWLPVDRRAPDDPQRPWRLLAAALLGSVSAVAFVNIWLTVLPWDGIGELMLAHEGQPIPGFHWADFLSDTLSVFIMGGLIYGAVELVHRRRHVEQSTAELLRQHDQEARQNIANRLAAAQARLAPERLFELLVDIERRFDQRDPEAAPQLERLIQHLRVTQPTFAGPWVPLCKEVEGLHSWLALMGPLHRADWRCVTQVPDGLSQAPVPPMWVLPLVQQLCDSWPDGQPLSLHLEAERAEHGPLRIQLRLQGAATERLPMAEVLAAQGERIRLLAGPDARLQFGPNVWILDLPMSAVE